MVWWERLRGATVSLDGGEGGFCPGAHVSGTNNILSVCVMRVEYQRSPECRERV